ncbi:DUF4865 family protein [Rhizobium leucaenae]|uniref:DUF4865 family protein n=1 Tax=Rhizobium leucaenae TaxID=29450 RepID=A0A7W6ZPN2_9HYPH|nr:DUF4865 family protein [Rhizobium leucaenae]MBB4566453.1 hypothetical protein [Rhizobium leucaenae]MBB6301653.1 hypothetical protein [Rhizobium leucaenae]
MIAMQYSFTLPADYDMAIIDRRIRGKGPMLDNFPGLKFKAYLSARKGDARTGSRENLYSPFYVWEKDEGLSNFICGPGFAGVTQSFGWQQVKTWVVWRADISPDIQNARFAIREIFQTGPYVPLAEIRQRESDEAAGEVASGEALASVVAFEPTSWTRVRFRLLADLPKDVLRPGVQAYDVGHLSLSDAG